MMNVLGFFVCFCVVLVTQAKHVDYSGYKVLRIIPKSEADLDLLHKLRSDYSVDLWNDPKHPGVPVMTHLRPELSDAVEEMFRKKNIEYDVSFEDLQKVIDSERVMNAPTNASHASGFDFGKYNRYDDIVKLLQYLSSNYPNIAKLQTIGKTYENRPIYVLKISSGSSTTKPAVVVECGIHAREWSSVAACAYLANQLTTSYSSNNDVKTLVDKYEFHMIVESNPDGYIYTWDEDRLWRKTRSHSRVDFLGICRGADANRNFDIDHCGAGTSRKPCDETYCGDRPFSESEARALGDLIRNLGSRIAAYFSVHAFSQFWMTPYSNSPKLPPNYSDLQRIGLAGTRALAQKYGTQFKFGTITNVIYEATGSSVDYAYIKHNVKIAFALELRDQGRHGFFLPRNLIIPMCEETYDGIVGAVKAL